MKLGGEFAVHLRKDDDLVTFLPGDDVPEWAAKQITNPLAWGKQPDRVEVAVGPGGSTSFGERLSSDGKTPDGPPPQGGAGASRQKWADYAAANGVEVEADWKREDIITACEKAGVPV
ncbi:hypothetical protein [Nocardia sp. NPDC019302]|uniref:hypothetical protein n=1 Tax=Nocardia sp. NPDC019302 TaxID=3154592 RepID=UPI0033F20C60